MKPKIGISENDLSNVTQLLSILLADEMTLYIKTRKSHWNVNGKSFMELHKLFERQYQQLEEYIDEIAERIGKLGSNTIGTMKEFISLSTLKENPAKYPTQTDMLQELLNDHETLIRQLRKQIENCSKKYNDAGTADFLTGIMEAHETISWILRRYLNK